MTMAILTVFVILFPIFLIALAHDRWTENRAGEKRKDAYMRQKLHMEI